MGAYYSMRYESLSRDFDNRMFENRVNEMFSNHSHQQATSSNNNNNNSNNYLDYNSNHNGKFF